MQVSIIIPLYNCLPHTRECLRTLQATLPVGLAQEIIFVDDGSTDGSREWLATVPSPCRVILNETNLGFAGACNRGAASATGEFLFFLNNDLIFLPGWLEPMLKVLVRRPDAALVGNIQRNAATGAIDHAGISVNLKGQLEHETSRPLFSRLTGLRRVPALTGACFAIRQSLWQQLGGFDEGFINGGEDVDLCLRASSQGRRNYVALRSVVRHHISASPGRKLRDEQNSLRLFRRWRSEIAHLAGRDWCRDFIVRHWELSCVFDHALGRAALRHWLWPNSPAHESVQTGVAASLDLDPARANPLPPTTPSVPIDRI